MFLGDWGKPTIPASAQFAVELPHAISILIIAPCYYICAHRNQTVQQHCFTCTHKHCSQYTLWTIKNVPLCFWLKLQHLLVDFCIFVPVEIRVNTLQFTYLTAWRCHNCVTSHVAKVYFIKFLLKNKLSSLKIGLKFLSKTYGNVKDFLPEDW